MLTIKPWTAEDQDAFEATSARYAAADAAREFWAGVVDYTLLTVASLLSLAGWLGLWLGR